MSDYGMLVCVGMDRINVPDSDTTSVLLRED